MRYVLDASVALKTILKEADSARAIALRDDFRNRLVELIAPDILPVEISHALARAERRGIIAKGQAKPLLLNFIQPCPILHTYGDFLERALEISSDFRVGIYDALYVSLAEQEGCDLVTADAKLITSLPGFPIVSLDSL